MFLWRLHLGSSLRFPWPASRGFPSGQPNTPRSTSFAAAAANHTTVSMSLLCLLRRRSSPPSHERLYLLNQSRPLCICLPTSTSARAEVVDEQSACVGSTPHKKSDVEPEAPTMCIVRGKADRHRFTLMRRSRCGVVWCVGAVHNTSNFITAVVIGPMKTAHEVTYHVVQRLRAVSQRVAPYYPAWSVTLEQL